MDMVYAKGQVEGALSTGAQGAGINPAFGIVPGSTTDPNFYRDDEIKYHSRLHRAIRQVNFFTGQLGAPSSSKNESAGAYAYAPSTLTGYTWQYAPSDATGFEYTLHWQLSAAEDAVSMAVTARFPSHWHEMWVAVGFSVAGSMVGSEAIIGTVGGGDARVAQYELTGKSVEMVRLVDASVHPSSWAMSNASISLVDGLLLMSFRRPLTDRTPAGATLLAHGLSHLLWAAGNAASPSYHGSGRGRYTLDLSAQDGSDATTEVANTCSAESVYATAMCYVSQEAAANTPWDDAIGRYDRTAAIDREYRVAWTIDETTNTSNPTLRMMLQARTLGWVGFGLLGSQGYEYDRHGMIRTDMWIGHVDHRGVARIEDFWSTSVRAPTKDLDLNNADGINGTSSLFDVSGFEDRSTGITTIRFSRRLETFDPFDYPIGRGPIAVVFAYNRQGQDDLTSYHGPIRGYATLDFWPVRDREVTIVTFLAVGVSAAVIVALVVILLLRRQARAQRVFVLVGTEKLPDLTLSTSCRYHTCAWRVPNWGFYSSDAPPQTFC